ncbi:hypothetical protein KAH81_08790 [bacterium]|nr:hypothetical protein [bacterium]
MRYLVRVLIILALITPVFADGEAAAFLTMPIGWENVALGGCGTALGGVGSGWFNPASIQKMKGLGVSSGYSMLALDRSLYNLSAGWNIKNDAAVALTWVHADAGEISGRDISGNYTDQLNYGEDAIFLTFSKVVTSDLSVGVNAKYLQARLNEITAYVAGFDLGIHGELLNDQLAIGVAYQNIGMKYQWNSAKVYGTENASNSDESIPSNLRGGILYRLKVVPIGITAETEYYKFEEFKFRGGVFGNPVEDITLAAGLDDLLPTFGAGYKFDADFCKFGVGYSLRLEREGLPPRHSFNISAEF